MDMYLYKILLDLASAASADADNHDCDLGHFLNCAMPLFNEKLECAQASVIQISGQDIIVVWPENITVAAELLPAGFNVNDLKDLFVTLPDTGYRMLEADLLYYVYSLPENCFLVLSRKSKFAEGLPENLLTVVRILGRSFLAISELLRTRLAEETIMQERELLKKILDNIPEPVYVKDTEGRKIFLNKAEADLLNAGSVEEVLGKPDSDFYPPDVAEKTRIEDLHVIQSRTPLIHEEGMVTTRTGLKIWLEGNKIPYFDSNDKVLGIIGISHNITNRKKTERETREIAEKYQSIFNSFLDLYYRSDAQGNILILSPSVYQLSGYRPEELIGKKVDVVYEDVNSRNRMIELLLKKGSLNDYENVLVKKDGTRVPVSITSHLIYGPDGKPEFIEGSIRDISERKSTEKKLAKLLDQQKLIAHLATEFINIPIDNSDQAIDKLLSLIGLQNSIDRVYIFLYDFVSQKMSNTHEWCAEGVSPEKANLQSIPLELFREWVQTHMRGEMLIVPDVSLLEETDNLRRILEPQNIKTLITVPMMREEQCLGFVGFDSVKTTKEWGQEEIQFLHLLSDLLCNLFDRKNTEQALKTQEAYLQAIFNNVPYQMWLKDVDGRYLLVNQTFIDYFNFRNKDSLLNKKAIDIWAPEVAARFTQFDHEVMQTRELKIIEEQFEFNGKKVWLEIYRAPIIDPEGNLLGTTGIAHDITSRIASDLELKKATQEAKSANIAKSRFLANMSHEIRTPLNAIIGMERLLAESNVTDPQMKLLQNMKTSSETLLNIVNDILDFSKIESGQIKIEKTDFSLNEVLRKVYDANEYRAEDKGIKFRCINDNTIFEFLKGDPVHLQQILMNLVSNAIKFTQKGFVKLQCKLTGNVNGRQSIFFLVEDTGIGISSENQKKIFDSFQQEDESITRTYGGTGLGLAISKQLVEHMGGVLYVDSIKNSGSKFYFTLDFEKGLQPKAGIEHKHSTEIKNALSGINVLLVEDNKFNQFVAQALLEKWSATTDVSEDGQQALDKLRTKSFDIILMDIQMPVMDGITAATIIRNELKLQTPILALTANVVLGIVEKCEKAGMQGYVSKPFEEDELYYKIVSVLNSVKGGKHVPETEVESPVLCDVSGLMKMVGNDPGMLKKMLQKFLEVTPHYVRDLEEASKNLDIYAIERKSHKINSSLALVSNEIMRNLIIKINNTGKEGKLTEELHKEIKQFLVYFKVLTEQLKAQIREN